MDDARFETIARLFAERKLSRRRAVQRGAVGLAAAGVAATGLNTAAAQDGTPPADATYKRIEYLFVQSFDSGSIAPKEGEEGAYTVTLQHGLGQTIYFSDRPERIVGATPTGTFLRGLGFGADNPPNAALVIGADDGATDIAVVELTNPVYDDESATATYDMAVLENFSGDGQPFQADPVNLADVAASFGAAHLFIDGCTPQSVYCVDSSTGERRFLGDGINFCFGDGLCSPCDPFEGDDVCHTYAVWKYFCAYSGEYGNEACPSGDCWPSYSDDLAHEICG